MCQRAATRRDFLQRLALGSTVGASILDVAFRRAAWAQTMAAGAPTDLFDIQKVADGVYFAFARPQAVGNCNAAVFVNSADVLVVDAHSKPDGKGRHGQEGGVVAGGDPEEYAVEFDPGASGRWLRRGNPRRPR